MIFVAVVLGVADARARRSELDLASADGFEVTHAVLVLELAVDDVGPDEELGVTVRAEASAALDAVFVDDAQRAKVLVLGVVVVGKGERVERVEPAFEVLVRA